jgi:SAM-dependent methyltransferase
MTGKTISRFEAPRVVHQRPRPFENYTAETLWNDEHISARMLEFHLDPVLEPASRPHAFIERSAAWIAGRFALGPGRRVADLGCGPGLYASRFAATGAAVTGVDFSARSIAHAREQARRAGQDIEYVEANYLDCRLRPGFDLVTLIYCDLCPLSPDQRRQLLTRIAGLLAEDGSLLLDVVTLNAFAKRDESSSHGFRFMDGFWAPGDYWGFLSTFRYEAERVVLDLYSIVEPHRTRRVYNWLQYFSRESLADELAACGLEAVEWYGDVAGSAATADDDTMAVVARRA